MKLDVTFSNIKLSRLHIIRKLFFSVEMLSFNQSLLCSINLQFLRNESSESHLQQSRNSSSINENSNSRFPGKFRKYFTSN